MKNSDHIGKGNVYGTPRSVDGRLLQEITQFIRSNNISPLQARKMFSKEVYGLVAGKEKGVPLSIFDNDKISALEAVVKYLKENKGLKLKDIARTLNRNSKTIWTTYNNASRKMPEPIAADDMGASLPLELFQDRETSPLEVVVRYMKDRLGFKNNEIARMLHRDQRTIWATYNRKKG